MNSWTIYGKNGVAKAEVNELELHDEWMAECFLTVSVKSAEPIDFAVDDYIDYRNERYAIQYDPTLLKKARRNSYGEGFVYDNIKFVNEAQAKIVRCDFNDIVLAPESESNKIHYSTLPTFPFYCETVDDLLDRILANLEDLYPGEFTIIGLNTVRNQERGELTHNDTYIEEYKKWIDPTMTPNTDPYGKIGVAEAVDNINCWNALAKVNEDFGLNFILRGYTIIVGTVGVFTANKFRYGKGNGLYEIEHISDSEQQIITRLRAYGSNANLPSRYYANLNMECYGVALADGVGSTTVDIDFKKSLFKNEFNGSEVAVGLRIGSTEYPDSVAWINGVTGKTIINTRTDDPIAKDTKIYFISGINRDEWPVGSRDYATENLPDNMAISRLMLPGFPNKSLFDWVIDNGGTVVDEEKGIATINDFTGAFSKDKYRPYIDSPNTELYSIRPASIYFDGSDDTEDIHPTIEGMTYQGHAIDVITSAEQITDNGVYKEGETVPNFKITLPDLGFDLKEAWVENATINMKDGMCSARAFVIASQPKLLSNGKWECSCKREHDDTLDLWFPYNDFQIKAGDHYVLTGIDMPDAYVNAASERLFTAAIDALVKNHAPRFTFQPRIDELWMQRQHDQHLANPNVIVSLHDTLKSGDVFVFADDDLGIDASIIIDVLTIKENGNNGIPTYEITLRDEKQVSPIKKIQNKVEVLSLGGVYGGTGGLSGRQVQSLIDTYGSDRFLSKVNDDEAQGILRFLQSLSVGSDLNVGGALDVRGTAYLHDATRIDGLLRALANIITNRIESEHYEGGWDNPFGSGFQINERSTDHVSFLSVDNLFVRMKAVFTELEIRKISYAGGNIIFSHAGSRIVSVQPIYDTCDVSFDGKTAVLDGSAEFTGDTLHVNAGGAFDGTTLKFSDASPKLVAYRCYLMKDDGTTATENWWRVDDQARCQTFNIDETGTYHNVSNSFYWRRVMGVGTELLEDGLNYDYVDLSVIDAVEGSTEPQAGDTIVQMGNRTDTERQGFISIQVAGEYAPSFEVYKGVNSYSLSGKRKICISPKYTEIRANRIIETTETGDYPLPHFRTEAWYTGMQCYYYDVVQHNGSSWLCIYPEGGIGGVPYTTEEPSEMANYWRIFASEGKTGGETLTVYAWGTSDETAPAISGNAYPPAGWSTRITDRPSGGDYYLWMAETKKNSDGTIDAWGIPACISGADGTPGEDAKNIEFIYKYDANGYDGNTGEVSPSGAASGSDTNKQQDDWVPNGWYDRALAISESNPDVYMSSRKYDASTETWGTFGTPTLWGHYGSKGIDGDGVQYVYKLFDHELTDAERTSNIPTKPAEPNPQGEWIPTGWSDDPQAPTSSIPFCYCSVIKEINGTWGLFEKLGLWSKWAEDGEDGLSAAVAICTPQVISIPTDTSGNALEEFRQVVPITMSTNSEELSLYDITILSGGENVELGPATLESHVGSKTTFSGNTAVIGNASFSGSTLVVEDGGSTLVPKTLIVKCAEGATITEHICEIEVKGYDSDMNEYTAKTSISVQLNMRGNDGSSQVTVFRWNNSGTVPPPISGTAYPPSGWSINPPNRPSGDDQYLWASYSVRYYNGTIAGWSTPVRISGDTGSAGEDAKEREWIYKRSDTNPGTPPNPSDRTIDDYVPAGWNDNPSGIDEDHKTEWASWRDFNKETQLWGDFAAPIVWSNYGERGMDGDGVEYVFIRTNSNVAPSIVNSPDSRTDSHGRTYIDDEYLPLATGGTLSSQTECTDDPTGTDKNNQFEWVSKRIKILNADGKTRSWQKYVGAMSLWANWSDDGVSVSLTPQSVILTQNEAGVMPTLTDANTKIIVKLGEVDVTSQATIISATPSTYVVSGATYNTCTCSYNNTTKTVTITAIDQHGTETVSGQTINKYCDQGYIDIVVRYNGEDTTIRFNFYCNLLGTWKREVVGDAEYVAAQKAIWEMDDRGVPQKGTYDYTGIADATQSLSQWRSNKEGTYDGYDARIVNTNSRIDTANLHLQTLERVVGENMSLADPDGWEQGSTTGEAQGKTYSEIKDDSSYRIRTKELIAVTKDAYLVFNVESTYYVDILYFDSSRTMIGELESGWKHLSEITSGKIKISDGSVKFIALLLAKNSATGTAISVSDLSNCGLSVINNPTVTSSELKQTADSITSNITDGLYNTGIDIVNRKITIRSDKVEFKDSSGNDAKFSINSTDGSMKAEGGGTIGGFEIGTDTLGSDTILDSRGYAKMNRHGILSLYNHNTSDDEALNVNGGAEILGSSGKPITLANNSGDISANGNTLNLNTSANNNNQVNIGGSATASVNINGSAANFGSSTAVTIGNILAVSGIASLGGNIISGSGTQTLPPTPKFGEFYFCKGTSGDMTIQVDSGTSHQIQMSSSGSESTSISINRDAHILVYMETNKWVDFKCN